MQQPRKVQKQHRHNNISNTRKPQSKNACTETNNGQIRSCPISLTSQSHISNADKFENGKQIYTKQTLGRWIFDTPTSQGKLPHTNQLMEKSVRTASY